ncbi:MAG: pyridoxamine 5*-phosphate oxidase family protein [Chloroflexi bacterium AL-W]|nr:pyridoxamine 5*-phosphate oxidase family protein [Chloroflexi bacterium AL-N1]NOK66596.1 pyridoxamine 5*-phosphate oxidase family protein [Chloroflexi bacterium AL-N10]NOK71984.1 pyridoxamine 5*-phosphate oxidase family protein [Chloroflexi bacterium AL-N5]NOK81241.1 pyridoxamine 5*-phosphate oxidase family protein [Chloroflexi bacterium AL-W]NOK89514.1 pyridoxamine 5*-phosphate oxidase family protein [Chloroflexi bacterium AL-N15]
MHETTEDIAQLQRTLDASIERAGTFLREAFEMPNRSLSATQIIEYYDQPRTVALATVTVRGEPRVAPIWSIMFRGQFYIPTVATAIRTRHLAQRPGVSFTHYIGNDLAIIVHGQATLIRENDGLFTELENLLHTLSGQRVSDWGEGVYIQILAETMYTFQRNSEEG